MQNWGNLGWQKLLEIGKTHVTTRVMGTYGYEDPVYISTGKLRYNYRIYGEALKT